MDFSDLQFWIHSKKILVKLRKNQLFGQNLSLEVGGGGQARWQVGSLPGAFSEKAFQHCWRQN